MSGAEFIRELDGYGALRPPGSACLVKVGDDFFVVSSIPNGPEGGGPETLAFAADENAEVTNWADVAGGRGCSREETIAELVTKGPDAEAQGRGIYGNTKPASDRSAGEILTAGLGVLDSIAKRFEEEEAS